ncbi:hypothetical protein C8R45DRAFT_944429 [Mycena sanguinolenta]|nr:hypothetical protein C8R45DRAFT_944429 [Mycena sanguinolenta]
MSKRRPHLIDHDSLIATGCTLIVPDCMPIVKDGKLHGYDHRSAMKRQKAETQESHEQIPEFMTSPVQRDNTSRGTWFEYLLQDTGTPIKVAPEDMAVESKVDAATPEARNDTIGPEVSLPDEVYKSKMTGSEPKEWYHYWKVKFSWVSRVPLLERQESVIYREKWYPIPPEDPLPKVSGQKLHFGHGARLLLSKVFAFLLECFSSFWSYSIPCGCISASTCIYSCGEHLPMRFARNELLDFLPWLAHIDCSLWGALITFFTHTGPQDLFFSKFQWIPRLHLGLQVQIPNRYQGYLIPAYIYTAPNELTICIADITNRLPQSLTVYSFLLFRTVIPHRILHLQLLAAHSESVQIGIQGGTCSTLHILIAKTILHTTATSLHCSRDGASGAGLSWSPLVLAKFGSGNRFKPEPE